MRLAAGLGGLPETQCEPGRELLRLCEVGLRAGGERGSRDGRDPLVGRHAPALVDENGKVALAQLVEGGRIGDLVAVETGIGTDPGRLALFVGAVVVGRDHADCALGLYLQRQFPPELDGLADQRGQQGHLGDQRLDPMRVVVLFQDPAQHAVKPRHPAADVGGVKLEGQDGIVPREFLANIHGVSLIAGAWHTGAI